MKKRLLVVEDDEALADVLCHNLEHEGFDVQHAADGTVALSTARTFAPDVVLLDLMLSGTNRSPTPATPAAGRAHSGQHHPGAPADRRSLENRA